VHSLRGTLLGWLGAAVRSDARAGAIRYRPVVAAHATTTITQTNKR